MADESPFIFGAPTVFVAPTDTDPDECDPLDTSDPDNPWALVHPPVPDFPPPDA